MPFILIEIDIPLQALVCLLYKSCPRKGKDMPVISGAALKRKEED
jgi:hypothetical protein